MVQLPAEKLQPSFNNQSTSLSQGFLPSWPTTQQNHLQQQQTNFSTCNSLSMQYNNNNQQYQQAPNHQQQHQQILSSTPDSGIQSIDGSPPSILSYTSPMISPCNNQV